MWLGPVVQWKQLDHVCFGSGGSFVKVEKTSKLRLGNVVWQTEEGGRDDDVYLTVEANQTVMLNKNEIYFSRGKMDSVGFFSKLLSGFLL